MEVFNCLKDAEQLRRNTLLLTPKSLGIPDTHLIDLSQPWNRSLVLKPGPLHCKSQPLS